jgi:peptidoglycan/xylan/chitin deacetylase (PgdA/CDA1 family)
MDRRSALQAAAVVAAGVASAAACGTADDGNAGDRGSGPATGGPTQPGPTNPRGPVSPSSAARPGPLPPEIVNGPRDRPNVALTFHGQGDANQVRALLDELARGDVRVTVLAVGSWLDTEPSMATRVLDRGHELGNHTQNHLAVAKMAAPQAFAEINNCAQLLKQLTGSIGRWFRPSQTQFSTPTIRAQATRVGYPTCLSYDLDSLDYTDPGPAAIVRNTLSAVRNGSIVSLHFGHAGTVSALPEILDGLRQRNLRAVTMTEMVS